MTKHKQLTKYIENVIVAIEHDLKKIKTMLQQFYDAEGSTESQSTIDTTEDDSLKRIDGVFDGYYMVGSDQKKYPVPTNYASKSKLVPGDVLRLKILADGTLIYKISHLVERKTSKAILSYGDQKKIVAITEKGYAFMLNQAAVTFFKAQVGEEAYIITPINATNGYAALETVVKQHQLVKSTTKELSNLDSQSHASTDANTTVDVVGSEQIASPIELSKKNPTSPTTHSDVPKPAVASTDQSSNDIDLGTLAQ